MGTPKSASNCKIHNSHKKKSQRMKTNTNINYINNINNTNMNAGVNYDYDGDMNRDKGKQNGCIVVGERAQESEKGKIEKKYVEVVGQVYDSVVNGHQLIQQAVYFLGAVLRKIKNKNKPISYLQYLDECIKLFRASLYADVQQFIQSISKQIFTTTKNIDEEFNMLKEKDMNTAYLQ